MKQCDCDKPSMRDKLKVWLDTTHIRDGETLLVETLFAFSLGCGTAVVVMWSIAKFGG